MSNQRWAVILAGGDGTRLQSMTRAITGDNRPKQFVPASLMQHGCLWNSFVMVGRVDALLKMTRAALPEMYYEFAQLIPSFETTVERKALAELYTRIEDTNFSHQVLAVRPADLAVMRVRDVGWSDLGEPNRVLSTLARIGVESQLAASAS
jgi:mannose-1-phosphate guanylyltransferase